MKINNIFAKKILSSLGNETVEATIEFEGGLRISASVPAGISAGKYEIAKVPAETALKQIETIASICKGKNWIQETLDDELKKHGFGGNAVLAVSAAFWKVSNQINVKPNHFPKLMLLLFEGGKHGNPSLTIQEFMVIEDSIIEAVADYKKIKKYLEEKNIETTVGAEGGFSPISLNNFKALDIIKTVLPNKKIALDVADSFKDGEEISFAEIITQFTLESIEDPYTDEDWDKWIGFTKRYGRNILVIGDDLTTTNPERIKKAIDLGAINAVVIKPNQIGTITSALKAVETARKSGLKIVVSHRGEETNDTWLVDFAINIKADYVKFGGINRGERIAKYNRLLEIYKEFGE